MFRSARSSGYKNQWGVHKPSKIENFNFEVSTDGGGYISCEGRRVCDATMTCDGNGDQQNNGYEKRWAVPSARDLPNVLNMLNLNLQKCAEYFDHTCDEIYNTMSKNGMHWNAETRTGTGFGKGADFSSHDKRLLDLEAKMREFQRKLEINNWKGHSSSLQVVPSSGHDLVSEMNCRIRDVQKTVQLVECKVQDEQEDLWSEANEAVPCALMKSALKDMKSPGTPRKFLATLAPCVAAPLAAELPAAATHAAAPPITAPDVSLLAPATAAAAAAAAPAPVPASVLAPAAAAAASFSSSSAWSTHSSRSSTPQLFPHKKQANSSHVEVSGLSESFQIRIPKMYHLDIDNITLQDKTLEDMEDVCNTVAEQRFDSHHKYLPSRVRFCEEQLPMVTEEDADMKKYRKSGVKENSGRTTQECAGLVSPSQYKLSLHQDKYKCRESVWELSLLVGLPELDIGGSIATTIVILANAFLESMLALVINHTLVVDSDLYDAKAAQHWRILVGQHHENVHPVLGTSLTTRLCDGTFIDSSWWQHTLLTQAHQYTMDVFGVACGHWLCCITSLIWILLMWQDLLNGVRFMKAVFNMPKKGNISVLEFDEDGFVLTSISWTRFGFVLCIGVARLGVMLMTTYSGLAWLAYTRDLGTLLVDMAALKVIPDLDSLLFNSFISVPVKRLFRSLKPLPAGRLRLHRGLGVSPVLLATVAASALCLTSWLKIVPNISDARDIQEALCGGYHEFVFASNDDLGVLRVSETNRFGDLGVKQGRIIDYEVHVLSQIIHQGQTFLKSEKLVETSRSIGALAAFEVLPVAEALATAFDVGMGRRMGNTCDDYEIPKNKYDGNVERFWLAASFQASVPGASSCKEVQSSCWHETSLIIRLLCPVTCGCVSLVSGLHFDQGCPHMASCSHHGDLGGNRSCKDITDGQRGVEWFQYWKSWSESSGPGGKPRNSSNELVQGARGFIPLHCGNFSRTTADGEYNWMHRYCEPDDDRRAVSAFCPIACECHVEFHSSVCPESCSAGSSDSGGIGSGKGSGRGSSSDRGVGNSSGTY